MRTKKRNKKSLTTRFAKTKYPSRKDLRKSKTVNLCPLTVKFHLRVTTDCRQWAEKCSSISFQRISK